MAQTFWNGGSDILLELLVFMPPFYDPYVTEQRSVYDHVLFWKRLACRLHAMWRRKASTEEVGGRESYGGVIWQKEGPKQGHWVEGMHYKELGQVTADTLPFLSVWKFTITS